MSQQRVTVSLKDFLRVTVAQREKFPTVAEAAAELGMTAGSFKQRLVRERKRYPSIFESVPKYQAQRGPRTASEDEAKALLAQLTDSANDGE